MANQPKLSHSDCRLIAESMDKSLVSLAISQLIGEALEAQGREIVAGRALERIAHPPSVARLEDAAHNPQQIAKDALDTLEKLKEA